MTYHIMPGMLYPTQKKLARAIKTYINERNCQNPIIICTGISGAIIGPAVASMLNIAACIIRKPGDNQHHGDNAVLFLPKGIFDANLYSIDPLSVKIRFNNEDKLTFIFVDDFISTGETFTRMRKIANFQIAFLYNQDYIRHELYVKCECEIRIVK